ASSATGLKATSRRKASLWEVLSTLTATRDGSGHAGNVSVGPRHLPWFLPVGLVAFLLASLYTAWWTAQWDTWLLYGGAALLVMILALSTRLPRRQRFTAQRHRDIEALRESILTGSHVDASVASKQPSPSPATLLSVFVAQPLYSPALAFKLG